MKKSNFQINELPEDSLTNLTTLSMLILTGNNISYIHPQAVSNCPNLRYLYLAENAISSFDEGAMAQFDQAQVVDISFNQLSHIPADVFSGLESLQHINFESNAIKVSRALSLLQVSKRSRSNGVHCFLGDRSGCLLGYSSAAAVAAQQLHLERLSEYVSGRTFSAPSLSLQQQH